MSHAGVSGDSLTLSLASSHHFYCLFADTISASASLSPLVVISLSFFRCFGVALSYLNRTLGDISAGSRRLLLI